MAAWGTASPAWVGCRVFFADGAAGASCGGAGRGTFELFQPVSGKRQRPASGHAHSAVDDLRGAAAWIVQHSAVLYDDRMGPDRDRLRTVCTKTGGRAVECDANGAADCGRGGGAVRTDRLGCSVCNCKNRAENAGHRPCFRGRDALVLDRLSKGRTGAGGTAPNGASSGKFICTCPFLAGIWARGQR